MGLDDLVPDGAETSSSRGGGGGRNKKPPEEQEDKVVIGNEPNRKVFTEEKWEEVQRVIVNDFGMQVNEVKNKPASERYEILHEAALKASEQSYEPDEDLEEDRVCLVCGDAATDDTSVEIEGEMVHIHHTAAKIAKELNDES